MTGELTVVPDLNALLNLDECPDLHIVADRAAVQVNQIGLKDLYILSDNHILSNHLHSLKAVKSPRECLITLAAVHPIVYTEGVRQTVSCGERIHDVHFSPARIARTRHLTSEAAGALAPAAS